MAVTIQFKRGTKAELDLLASRRGLSEGEPLFLTDENRMAIATSSNAYTTFAQQAEAQSSEAIQITKNLTLVAGTWIDTGIVYSDLVPGTYILQMYASDNNSENQWYSGIVLWSSGASYGSGDEPTEELLLNSSGSSNKKILFLRTMRLNNATAIKLQIFSTYNTNSGYNYVFRFKQLISA